MIQEIIKLGDPLSTPEKLDITLSDKSVLIEEILELGEIGDLGNVTLSSVANNNFLVYDNSTSEWLNKSPSDTLVSLGLTASAVELNYNDISTLGLAEASKTLSFDSSGLTTLPDNFKIQIGTGSDLQLYHDGTDSFLTNAVGVLKIATETSGVPVQIGHSTSEVTVGQNLTVTGGLVVDTSVLKVDSANNRVGIGTATPAKVLHVVDTTGDAEIARFEGGDGNIAIEGGAKITFSRNAINYLSCTHPSGALRLETGGAGNNRLTIDSSGNSTFTGDVILDNAKSLRLSELDSNGSNHISIKAPDSVASNVILTLPVDAGTLIGSGDTSSVVNTMLAGSITANKMNNEIFEDLEALGAPSSDGQFIVATGSGTFAYESANTARTSLGLGTGDSPTFTSLTLSGQAAALAMNNQSITGLATPTSDADAATKSYVDGVAQGLSAKDSVRAATVVDGTLASAFANSQVIDGVTLATGDRILLKNQTSGSENGVYTVNASGAPTRSVDFDSNAEVAKGAFIFVEEGTTNADAGFVLTTDGSITLDTTSLAFTQFSGAGNITAGDALEKSGNTLSVKVDDSSIEVSSDTLRVKATGITSAMLAGSIANSKLNQLTTANKVALSSLDLDGGTDIGADLVDADLVVVDDGAGGTNRKSALSRMKKYIFSAVSGDATASDSGTLSLDSSSITGQTAKGSIADNDLILIADSADSNNLKKMTKATFVTGLGVASAIDDLSDVTITSAASSEYLRYNGSAWVDASLSIVDDTTPQLGGNLDPNGNSIAGHLKPSASDTYTLGSTSAEWADLYLGESSKIYFGNDQDVFLEHNPDEGLILDLTTDSGTNPEFTLKTAFSTVSAGATLQFLSETSSPAAGDIIATISADSRNAAAGNHSYGDIRFKIEDTTTDSEAGGIYFYPSTDGFPSGNNVTETLKLLGNTSGHRIVDVVGHDGANSGLKLDGTLVTSIASELNLLDGGTAVGSSITVADADGIIINDAGTMKTIPASDLKTYVNTGGSSADFSSVGENILPSAANTYSLGSATAEWSDLYMGDGSKIYLGNDQDVYLEHDPDDGIQMHMSSEGAIEPTFSIVHNNASSHYQGPSLQLHNTTMDSASDLIGSIRFTGASVSSSTVYASGLGGNSGTGTNIYFNVCPSGATQQTALDITGVSNTNGTIVRINDHNGSTTGLKLGNTLVTASGTDLNILDGVTSTTSEINLLDGGTSVGSSITVADADGFIVNDAGTMKTIPASDLKTYIGAGATSLNGLSDVTISSASSLDTIVHNGTAFENRQLKKSDIEGETQVVYQTIPISSFVPNVTDHTRTVSASNMKERDIFFYYVVNSVNQEGLITLNLPDISTVDVGDSFRINTTSSKYNIKFIASYTGANNDLIYASDGSNAYANVGLTFKSGTDTLTCEVTYNAGGNKMFYISDINPVLIDSLNDVTTSSLQDNQVLSWDATNSVWVNSTPSSGGSQLPPEVKTSTTSDFTVSLTPSNSSNFNDIEVIYAVSNSSTAVTATLPTAASIEGKKVHVKRLGTANVTVDGHSSETIDGSATFVLTTQYSSVTMISDGTNWIII